MTQEINPDNIKKLYPPRGFIPRNTIIYVKYGNGKSPKGVRERYDRMYGVIEGLNIGEVYKIKVLDHRIYEKRGEFMIMATMPNKNKVSSSSNITKEFIYPRDKFFKFNNPKTLLSTSFNRLSRNNRTKLLKNTDLTKTINMKIMNQKGIHHTNPRKNDVANGIIKIRNSKSKSKVRRQRKTITKKKSNQKKSN